MADRTIDEKSPDYHLETLKANIRPDDPVIVDREVKEKALVRRIDKRMMPLMMLICTCLTMNSTLLCLCH